MLLFNHLATLAAEGGGFNPLVPDGGTAFWTWLIFLLSAPFIWMVVMGPITRALEERDSKAQRAIEAAQKASDDAERARSEVEVKLGEARAEAAELLQQARSRAEVREREIVEAAESEAKATLETARRAIAAEKEKAVAAIREEMVDLSLSAAGAVIKRNVGSEDDRRLISDMVGQATVAGEDGDA